MKNKQYIGLITFLLLSFFLFTGGIMDAEDEGTQAVAPTINSFTQATETAEVFSPIRFTAAVTANSTDEYEDSCGELKTENETTDELETVLVMKYGDIIVATSRFLADDSYSESSDFTGDITIAYPGEYKVIATFTTVNYGDTLSTSDSMNITVTVGDQEVLSEGDYMLTEFSVKCAAAFSTYEQTQITGQNILSLDGQNVSLDVDFEMDSELLAQQPCITDDHYDFDVSGILMVYYFGDDLVLAVQNDEGDRVLFGLEYTASTISLYTNDQDKNEYRFIFTKQ